MNGNGDGESDDYDQDDPKTVEKVRPEMSEREKLKEEMKALTNKDKEKRTTANDKEDPAKPESGTDKIEK